MKTKLFYVAMALVMALSLVAVAVPASPVIAAPGTIQVNVNDGACVSGTGQTDPYAVVYCSIQDAITDATAGDTIVVAAGTYIEAIKVDKSLTLQGLPGAIIRPDNTTPTHDGARRCGIKVESHNVVIDGFEIDGTGGTVHYGIYALNSNNNAIKNNIVHDITNEIGAPGSDVAGVGIMAFGWDVGVDGTLINGNTVYNTGRMGIIVCAMKAADYTWFLCPNTIIRNNVVHHAWQGPTLDFGGAVQINAAKDCTIQGNSIYDTGTASSWGIYIVGSAANSNNIIQNNVYNNEYGIRFYSDRADTIANFGGGDTAGSPVVNFNNIYSNSIYGLYEQCGTCTVDAENNWWGHTSGPKDLAGTKEVTEDYSCAEVTVAEMLNANGLGDEVSDDVDYCPWRVATAAGCFIATAAYGTDTAGQLDVLRAFRDQVLLESTLGSQFVALYYDVSPPIADFIADNSLLRTAVRELLIDPIVSLAALTQGIWGN